jgi:hypothetical protein
MSLICCPIFLSCLERVNHIRALSSGMFNLALSWVVPDLPSHGTSYSCPNLVCPSPAFSLGQPICKCLSKYVLTLTFRIYVLVLPFLVYPVLASPGMSNLAQLWNVLELSCPGMSNLAQTCHGISETVFLFLPCPSISYPCPVPLCRSPALLCLS